MRHYFLFAVALLGLIACKDDDDDPSPYPIMYDFERVDQTDEGLYLLSTNDQLINLSANAGLYGAFKDSLKTELRDAVKVNLDLKGVEIIDENTINLHYKFQGFDFITPVDYNLVNGDYIIVDTLTTGLVSYDQAIDRFVLCAVTPFALGGPNAPNPFLAPYLQFNLDDCIEGYTNKDYAEDFVDLQPVQPLDTIGVLLTKYLFAK